MQLHLSLYPQSLTLSTQKKHHRASPAGDSKFLPPNSPAYWTYPQLISQHRANQREIIAPYFGTPERLLSGLSSQSASSVALACGPRSPTKATSGDSRASHQLQAVPEISNPTSQLAPRSGASDSLRKVPSDTTSTSSWSSTKRCLPAKPPQPRFRLFDDLPDSLPATPSPTPSRDRRRVGAAFAPEKMQDRNSRRSKDNTLRVRREPIC